MIGTVAEPEHPDDAGVVQPVQHLGLADEAEPGQRVVDVIRAHDLDHDRRVKPLVEREPCLVDRPRRRG